MHDYVVEIDEDAGFVRIDNLIPAPELEIFDHVAEIIEINNGPQGVPGDPGLVLLQVDDPDPDPIIDGVLYLRLTS